MDYSTHVDLGERAPATAHGSSQPGLFAETVTEVEHYSDRVFRFRITRPASFRFRSGEFVMLGLPDAERPIFRAYSITSPTWDDGLGFYSIKLADSPLTRRLQRIKPGDTVLMRKKATGSLVLDALLPGRRLYLFATGTGIAPFASLIRDPDIYDRFDHVILTNTCRSVADLAYGDALAAQLHDDPLVGEIAGDRLTYYSSVTGEPYIRTGRITTLIATGKLFGDLGLPPLDPADDRAMICGSMAMLQETRDLCAQAGLIEGSNNAPGSYVVERAFVG